MQSTVLKILNSVLDYDISDLYFIYDYQFSKHKICFLQLVLF